MRILERYTGERIYMYPAGGLATPEIMQVKYPAILAFQHIVETDEKHEVCFAIQNLSAARGMNHIDPSLSDDEAIAELQRILNTPPIVDDAPSTEERMAAALEFQNMLALASLEEQMEGGESA